MKTVSYSVKKEIFYSNNEKQIFLSGASDDNGELRIFEKSEFKQFLKDAKGSRITMHIKASGMNKDASFLKYYWGVLIPKIRQGYIQTGTIISNTGAEMEMRKMCQLYEETPKEDGTGYKKRLKSVSELDETELYDYIFILKIIVAEYLNIYVDDPITY